MTVRRRSQRVQQVAAPASSGAAVEISNTGSSGTRAARRRSGGPENFVKEAAVSQAKQQTPAPVRSTSVEISADQVLAAVESLYADELKPVGRILRKRVVELLLLAGNSETENASPDVDADQLRSVCGESDLCSIEPEEGGDWSALLVGRQRAFVDIYNPEDVYSDQMWTGLRTYCESPDGQSMSLPGGRYACARALVSRGLQCLMGYSLGRVCHIVQLAITQKKILGYMNGSVVAYSKSQSKVKEQCALAGQAIAATAPGAEVLPVASFEEARTSMAQILQESAGQVPLSNVKRLFRSKFQLELSETSLGHAKLSELLQDPDFRDVCTVELREHGYVVVQATQDLEPIRVELCPDEPLTLDDAGALLTPAPVRLVPSPIQTPSGCGVEHVTPSWALSPLRDSSDDFVGGVPRVQRTFIQYNVPRTPLPGSRRRSCSLPKDLEFGTSECEAARQIEESGGRRSRLSTVPSSGYTGEETPAMSISSVDGSSSADDEDQEQCEPLEPLAYERHLSFCPDEPLPLEDAGIIVGSAPPMQAPAPTWKPYTPGMLAREGCVVHNTFFHIAPALPTPIRTGAVRRAKSVPKDMGYTCSDFQLQEPSATVQEPPVTNVQPPLSALSLPLASPLPLFWAASSVPAAGPAAPTDLSALGAVADASPQESFVWGMPWRQPASFETSPIAPDLRCLPQPAPARPSSGNILYIERYI
mmetsp:Transcript_95766/g.166383  ORF Transcript_95766/g.166383 Transcript_95766/m.166383 type:complete len:705 (+) Transcript_95766:95-2209(+)